METWTVILTVLLVVLAVIFVIAIALYFCCRKEQGTRAAETEHSHLTKHTEYAQSNQSVEGPSSQTDTSNPNRPQSQDLQKVDETAGSESSPPKSVKCGVVGQENPLIKDVVTKFINTYEHMKKTPKLVPSDRITVMSRPQPSLLIVPCLIQSRLLTDIQRVVGSSGVKSASSSQVLLALHHRAPHNVNVTPTRIIISGTEEAALFYNNIVDVVFQKTDGGNILHDCPQNTTAVQELQKLAAGATM